MRIVSCVLFEHNPWLVLLAVAMCTFGCFATNQLWQKVLSTTARVRFNWLFLTAVTAGASIWATHFIGMLGRETNVPVTFDAQLTVVSIIIAIVGCALGFGVAAQKNFIISRLVGGSIIGLSIAAMHFVGMFAYRVDGIVTWSQGYIVLAIVLAIVFSALFVHITKLETKTFGEHGSKFAIASLFLAIVLLHFTGMAAFSVTPINSVSVGADSEAFNAMAMAIAMAAAIIVFTGISSQVIDDRMMARSQSELFHMATHDDLTGLPNRRYFSDVLARRYRELDQSGTQGFALMMIDLDRFKPVNDTLGHSFGDRVLKRVSERLSKITGEEDVLARLGGDEFAIIKPCRDGSGVTCAQVIELMSRPFVIDGHVIELGASLGLAIAPHDGTTPDELIQNADFALYAAKDDGRSTFKVYEASMSKDVQLRRSLELDLRRAVNREDFEVHYQPQIDARTGAYTGAEALVRWDHPERGMLSPAVFVPLAEELGLIDAIGSFVLAKACADAASWPSHLSIAVNLSPVQIMNRRLVRTLKTILADTGLDPTRLELEITETALLGNDVQALSVLQEIRSLGISISLDDFGTGYSSLSYLHRFPIDRIKIDRSFIGQVPNNKDSISIIQAIARLGSSLGMKVTAEGIETDAQRHFSQDEGCDHLQGYLISKPIPFAEIVKLFETVMTKEVAA